MLKEIEIKNLAIIERQSVEFGNGLNVISGETGSGKSIILNAIELVLGSRAKPSLVRSGAEALEVSAVFSLEGLSTGTLQNLPEIAKATSPVEGEPQDLLVSRTVTAEGKNKVYINGRIATLSLLEETVSCIVNICGQSSSVKLLQPDHHLEVLDAAAGNEALISEYEEAFYAYRNHKKKFDESDHAMKLSVRRKAELEFLLQELGNINWRQGLRDDLYAEIKAIEKVKTALNHGNNVFEYLSGANGVESLLGNVRSELLRMQSAAPESGINSNSANGGLSELSSQLLLELEQTTSYISLFKKNLNGIFKFLSLDDSGLEALTEELAEVSRLERKYRMSSEELCDFVTSTKSELVALEELSSPERIKLEMEALKARTLKIGAKLSEARQRSGEKLSKDIERELKELSMGEVVFKCNFQNFDEPQDGGLEKLEFLISTNSGESPKPLRQIASGGELSRVTLVLKKILKDRTGVNVLVFDEVDTGISGKVARSVGEKLKSLARDSQVICITHLPQVASLADKHLKVDKVSNASRTLSVVKEVVGKERVEEIARMLSGHKITPASLKSAEELISQ